MDQSSLASQSIMNLKKMPINNENIKLYKKIFPTLYNKKPLNIFIKSSLNIDYNNGIESLKKNNNLKNQKLNVIYRANKSNDKISILPSLTEQNIYYNKEVDDILINDDDKNKIKKFFSSGNKNKSIHFIKSKKINEEKKLYDNKTDKTTINSYSNRTRNITNLYKNALKMNNPSRTYRLNNEKTKINKHWKFLDEIHVKKSYFS